MSHPTRGSSLERREPRVGVFVPHREHGHLRREQCNHEVEIPRPLATVSVQSLRTRMNDK
jgi:hypothetical protein